MLPLAMLCSEDLPYTHGHGKDALEHFQQMCVEGVEPARVTLLALLAACSNAGQLDEGLFTIFLQQFSSMPAWLIFLAVPANSTRQRIWLYAHFKHLCHCCQVGSPDKYSEKTEVVDGCQTWI
jgi:hypothetical protein